MIDRLLNVSSARFQSSHQDSRSVFLAIVLGLLGFIVLLEFVSSIDAVFGYLYIVPILLANFRLNRRLAISLTVVASTLTLLNLWIPIGQTITAATIDNRLIAVFALIVTEILSDRNRCFQEAIAQERAKLRFQEKLASVREDFVSTLTHDLKTPLMGAIEMLKVLEQGRFGAITSEQHKVLNTMTRSHQSSLQLLETLLDVYRNDAEGVRLVRSPILLSRLIAQVIEALSDLALSYRVSLNLRCSEADQDLQVNGDSLQLQRVVSNLLMNAIHHSPIDGSVEVVVEACGDRAQRQQVIKVMDEGPGIQPDEMPHLFQRFYQGQSDRQAKGSGLGLYLSRQIVEAHGGTVWAENRASRGAVFGFCLPVSSTC